MAYLFGMVPEPAAHKPIVHKRTKRFTRLQSDIFVRVRPSWRNPRGIDGRQRRKERGTAPHPNVGYGTDAEVRGMLPNGFRPFIVRNLADLEMLTTQNTTHCAVISHMVGAQLRRKIEARAAELDVLVANAGCRMKKQEEK